MANVSFRDVFSNTGQGITYRDVFSPSSPIVTDPGTGTGITDALLMEDGSLLLTEDGLSYLALEVSVSVS